MWLEMRAAQLAAMLAELTPEQLGQLQFIVAQVKDPQGMRTFQIPKSGLMSVDDFPYFMCLYFEDQGIGDVPNVFDMRDENLVVLTFFI